MGEKPFPYKSSLIKGTGELLLPGPIFEVSSLPTSMSSKDSFQPLHFIWSSEPRAQQLDMKVPTVGREGCLCLHVCSIPVCDSHWGIPETGHRGPWLSFYTEKPYHLAQCCRATCWCPVSARYITLDAFYLTLRGWEGSSRRFVCVCLSKNVMLSEFDWLKHTDSRGQNHCRAHIRCWLNRLFTTCWVHFQ